MALRGRAISMLAAVALVAALLGLHPASPAGAVLLNPGDLDVGFGTGGVTLTNIGTVPGDESIRALGVQDDGKIVAAGGGPTGNFVLLRYTADGALDTSFGSGGVVRDVFGAGSGSANAVAIQPDGKIVAAGSARDDFALARFLPDGSLDPSFGDGGRIRTGLGLYRAAQANALAIRPGGGIVAAGRVGGEYGGASGDLTLIAYTAAGVPDADFGDGGVVVTNAGGDEAAHGMALQLDGKIVVVGSKWRVDAQGYLLLRYTSGGRLDSSFGQDGTVEATFGAERTSDLYAVCVQADGKIIAGGESRPYTSRNSDFALVRYDQSGNPDNSFGAAGRVLTPFPPGGAGIRALVLQPDGKITAAGTALTEGVPGPTGFALARYTGNGSLDPSFDTDGKLITPFGQRYGSGAYALKLQPDGRLVAGGTAVITGTAELTSFTLIRYEPDGNLDESFGGRGIATADLAYGTDDRGYALAVQSDGRIVVAGKASAPPGADPVSNFALARYTASGAPDLSFGNEGRVETDFGDRFDVANAVAVLPDGKIVAAGRGGGWFGLARYNADGSLDSSFGTGGRVITPFGDEPSMPIYNFAEAKSLALQPDGKVVAAGYRHLRIHRVYLATGFAIARYNVDGSLDATFGDRGKIATPFLFPGYPAPNEMIHDVAVQPDGKIVATASGGIDLVLARYNPDGTPDGSFGNNARVHTTIPYVGPVPANQLVLTNGKIVVGGKLWSYVPEIVLARYDLDGTLDQGFGQGGIARAMLGEDATTVHEMIAQPDGKLLVAGRAGGCVLEPKCETSGSFGLARFNADGTLDTGFGNQGRVVTSPGPDRTAVFYGVGLQADGRIVAAGHTVSSGGDRDFAVLRYAGSRMDVPEPTPTTGPGCLFSDVCPSDYFFTPVQYLLAQGAVSGYDNNTFRPYQSVTRGQLTKIVALAEGWTVDGGGEQHFSDVPPNNPFFPYVQTAYRKGIISGYDDGTFRWGATATRGQIAKILALAEGWSTSNDGEQHFSDVPRSNPFFQYVAAAYEHGVISGYADGTFRWGANATRGQVAKMVHLSVTEAAPSPTPATTTTAVAAGSATATATAAPIAGDKPRSKP